MMRELFYIFSLIKKNGNEGFFNFFLTDMVIKMGNEAPLKKHEGRPENKESILVDLSKYLKYVHVA